MQQVHRLGPDCAHGKVYGRQQGHSKGFNIEQEWVSVGRACSATLHNGSPHWIQTPDSSMGHSIPWIYE